MKNSRRSFLALVAAVVVAKVVNAGEPVRVSIRLAGGKLVEGPKVIRLKRNDAVVLTVVSDAPDELHLHGYNLSLKLAPNQPATLRFSAKHTGRFGFELHKLDREIGAFEIYPE